MNLKKHYKPIDVYRAVPVKRRWAPVVVGAGPIFHRPAVSFLPFGGLCISTNGETETLHQDGPKKHNTDLVVVENEGAGIVNSSNICFMSNERSGSSLTRATVRNVKAGLHIRLEALRL